MNWKAKPETPGFYFVITVNRPDTLGLACVYPVASSDAAAGKGMRVARAGFVHVLPCEELPKDLRYLGPIEPPSRFPVYREVEEEIADVYEDDDF